VKIGFLDSGVGGLSVLVRAQAALPCHDYFYCADQAFVPYGEKKPEEISRRALELCEGLVSRGCRAIVLACNTATACTIDTARSLFPVPIVGMEPAIKPARAAAGRLPVWVLATQATLSLPRFFTLMDSVGGEFICTPAPDLVEEIESGGSGERALYSLRNEISGREIGAVVLGCTHFVFARQALMESVSVPVFDGNEGTVRRLTQIAGQTQGTGNVEFFSTAGREAALLDIWSKITAN